MRTSRIRDDFAAKSVAGRSPQSSDNCDFTQDPRTRTSSWRSVPSILWKALHGTKRAEKSLKIAKNPDFSFDLCAHAVLWLA
jgi:hypothetical protein